MKLHSSSLLVFWMSSLSVGVFAAQPTKLVFPKDKSRIVRASDRLREETVAYLKSANGLDATAVLAADRGAKRVVGETLGLVSDLVPSTVKMNKIEVIKVDSGSALFTFENKSGLKIYCEVLRERINDKPVEYMESLSCNDKNGASRMSVVKMQNRIVSTEESVESQKVKPLEKDSYADIAAKKTSSDIESLVASYDSIQKDIRDLLGVNVGRPLEIGTQRGKVVSFEVVSPSNSVTHACLISVEIKALACATNDNAFSYLGMSGTSYVEFINGL